MLYWLKTPSYLTPLDLSFCIVLLWWKKSCLMLHTMGEGLKKQNETTNKNPTNLKKTQPKPKLNQTTTPLPNLYSQDEILWRWNLWRSAYQVLQKRECSECGQMSTDEGCWVPLRQSGKIVGNEAQCNWPNASSSLILLSLSCQVPWPAHLQGSAWESRVSS